MSTITRDAAQALLDRATVLLLTAALQNNESRAQFARGSINTLRSLLTCDGTEFAARKDAASGAYQPPACLEAAWAALPIDIERLSLAEVQQFLTAQGVEIAPHLIADRNLKTVQQPKNDEIAALDLHNEHAATRVDVGNGSEHGKPSDVKAMVAEGGAA